MMNRLSLCHVPTPIHHFEALDQLVGCEVWVKRDDYTAGAAAGNKIRKLEYLLSIALSQNANVIVTCGAEQSNHARATSLCAAQFGLKSVLLLRTENPNRPPKPVGNILLDVIAGATIRWISPKEYEQRDKLLQEVESQLVSDGHRPFIIPEGGSNGIGAMGYVDAMREVRQQLDLGLVGSIREFDTVVMACGSGGTSAGTALGAKKYGIASRVDAIAVAHSTKYFKHQTDRIILQSRAFDSSLGASVPLVIHEQFRGPAYGVATTFQLKFIIDVARKTGVILDPVYTGKALFGLSNLPDRPRRALFIHTGGLPGMLAESEQFSPQLTSLESS
jgi:D-cysteine desulfhydrase